MFAVNAGVTPPPPLTRFPTPPSFINRPRQTARFTTRTPPPPITRQTIRPTTRPIVPTIPSSGSLSSLARECLDYIITSWGILSEFHFYSNRSTYLKLHFVFLTNKWAAVVVASLPTKETSPGVGTLTTSFSRNLNSLLMSWCWQLWVFWSNIFCVRRQVTCIL